MNKKYINIDLDDARIRDLADVISNKTSKKIIDYLVDHEASESEISQELSLPANTVNYNIKKLLKSGLIEKSKKWNWSVKGKKIPYYHVANKKIVISPKSLGNVKQMFVALISTGLIGLGIKSYTGQQFAIETVNIDKVVVENTERIAGASASGADFAAEAASDVMVEATQLPELWIWFLLGAITFLAIYFIFNKFKIFR